jgi:hypothetical protein
MPAKAGIQYPLLCRCVLGPRFRGDDRRSCSTAAIYRTTPDMQHGLRRGLVILSLR